VGFTVHAGPWTVVEEEEKVSAVMIQTAFTPLQERVKINITAVNRLEFAGNS
jgi:hypothetical protein